MNVGLLDNANVDRAFSSDSRSGVLVGGFDAHAVTAAPDEFGAAVVRAAVRHFQGAVRLDPVRAVKQLGQIVDEVLVHLQTDGEVEVIVEGRATSPDGYSERTVRTVTENSRASSSSTLVRVSRPNSRRWWQINLGFYQPERRSLTGRP